MSHTPRPWTMTYEILLVLASRRAACRAAVSPMSDAWMRAHGYMLPPLSHWHRWRRRKVETWRRKWDAVRMSARGL
jgi:hypothetical protein